MSVHSFHLPIVPFVPPPPLLLLLAVPAPGTDYYHLPLLPLKMTHC